MKTRRESAGLGIALIFNKNRISEMDAATAEYAPSGLFRV
jgi:hypothetical protein